MYNVVDGYYITPVNVIKLDSKKKPLIFVHFINHNIIYTYYPYKKKILTKIILFHAACHLLLL